MTKSPDRQALPVICTYRGQNVDEMSRADLIVAVKHLGKLYGEHLQQSMSDHKFYGELLRARR